MSFPFVQPYFGLGNSLQTAQGGSGPSVGGWVELARTTNGGTSTTIDVSSLADKRYYMILNSYVGARDNFLRFNADSGSNYAYRLQVDGALGTHVNQDKIEINGAASGTGARLSVGYVANLSTKEKLIQSWTVKQQAAGAGTAPNRAESVGKHAQTSNPIDQMTIVNTGSTFPAGAELVVLGWDPADEHTTNFWEELASVEGDGTSTTISSGTISAKKYLWVQAFTNASSQNTGFQFNNDTGNNYAIRRSSNGVTDATDTSIGYIEGSDTSKAFTNMFIINNSSNEKLTINHSIHNPTAGAGTSPTRNEVVGKWTNTSAQITEIDYMQQTTSVNFPSGSFLKVWGSD